MSVQRIRGSPRRGGTNHWEMPCRHPGTPVPHNLLPFLEHWEWNSPRSSWEERLRVGCLGHLPLISAPHVVLEPPHLLRPQALPHPLVLDAGDLVEEAAAVELQALVEFAVGQPLPGEEGGLG